MEDDDYLDIQIVGHNFVRAFKNKDKKEAKHPDYKGNGVGVWIRKKKAR